MLLVLWDNLIIVFLQILI